MHPTRRNLAITLFATALAATVFCMDRSAAASPVRASGAEAAQPWVARLTGNLRRSVRPSHVIARRQPQVATLAAATLAKRKAVGVTVACRLWSPSLFCLPPPAV